MALLGVLDETTSRCVKRCRLSRFVRVIGGAGNRPRRDATLPQLVWDGLAAIGAPCSH